MNTDDITSTTAGMENQSVERGACGSSLNATSSAASTAPITISTSSP